MNIENKGSLMTWAGTNTCLGYLMPFDGHGIFEPNHGKVDVTKEESEKHNAYFSEAEIKGLDESCQVGQCGTFYYSTAKGVRTWIGTVVCATPTVKGKTITFQRNGKTFKGKLRKNDDFFTFERVS